MTAEWTVLQESALGGQHAKPTEQITPLLFMQGRLPGKVVEIAAIEDRYCNVR